MSSILKVDTIQDADGNNIINENANTITIGASGDTTNVIGTLQNNGAGVGGTNTPAFEAYLSANQTISHDTVTKIQFNTEVYDTDNCYDNSTNYRFTPTTAGKYFVYGNIIGFANTSNLNSNRAIIKKNGTIVKYAFSDFRNNPAKTNSVMATTVVDMNGSSDYIELFALVEYSSSATVQVLGESYNYSAFGAYKILT